MAGAVRQALLLGEVGRVARRGRREGRAGMGAAAPARCGKEPGSAWRRRSLLHPLTTQAPHQTSQPEAARLPKARATRASRRRGAPPGAGPPRRLTASALAAR
jgi:hypothetical protein